MGIYEELLEKITEYISKEPITDDDEVISLYTLWNLIQKEAKKKEDLHTCNKDFLTFINYIYDEAFLKSDIYKKATENLDVKLPLFRPIQFKSITTSYSEETAEFKLWPAGRKNEKEFKAITIYRDFNDDNYYGDNINNYLIGICKHFLDAKFEDLRFYAKSNVNSESSYTIRNDLFEITTGYYNGTYTDLSVQLIADGNNSKDKKYYNKDCTINEFIKKHQDDILKATPVKVMGLDDYCYALVIKYLEAKKNIQKKKEINE